MTPLATQFDHPTPWRWIKIQAGVVAYKTLGCSNYGTLCQSIFRKTYGQLIEKSKAEGRQTESLANRSHTMTWKGHTVSLPHELLGQEQRLPDWPHHTVCSEKLARNCDCLGRVQSFQSPSLRSSAFEMCLTSRYTRATDGRRPASWHFNFLLAPAASSPTGQ